jgi:FkbM family methyltransferase
MLDKIGHHFPRVLHQLGKPIQLQGRKYAVRGYFSNRMAINFEDHEAGLSRVIWAAMENNPGAFIDIGVNTGQTLMKVLEADPERDYFGFEPQLGCCHQIEEFLKDNDLRTYAILPVALSDKDEVVKFYSQGMFDEMASMIKPDQGRARGNMTLVQARNGDALLEEIGVIAPAIIKIDVEGAEYQVVRGLEQTLRASLPALFFEVLPNFVGDQRTFLPDHICERQRATADALWAFIVGVGYKIFCIDNDGEKIPVAEFNMDEPDAFVSFNYAAEPKSQQTVKTS